MINAKFQSVSAGDGFGNVMVLYFQGVLFESVSISVYVLKLQTVCEVSMVSFTETKFFGLVDEG